MCIRDSTCVVFMSITVSHGADVNPYLFALDRCIDTLIGIAVSLCVNLFRLPRRKNRHLLFVLSLDSLAGEDGHISSYTRIKLNQLISRGARIAVAAPQPPAYFLPLLEEIGLKLPVKMCIRDRHHLWPQIRGIQRRAEGIHRHPGLHRG